MRQLSATTGMPHVMVRRNMQRVAGVMRRCGTVLRGLTRGLDLVVLDPASASTTATRSASIRGRDALGVVLPSNSPGRALAVGAGDRA